MASSPLQNIIMSISSFCNFLKCPMPINLTYRVFDMIYYEDPKDAVLNIHIQDIVEIQTLGWVRYFW